jgi:hypothetical protein
MPIVANKANSPGGAGLRCTNKPNLACPCTRRRVAVNKQTQSCGTPAAACRLGPARAGCTNKPNSTRSRRASPYKQTQSAPRQMGRRGPGWSLSCQTNPISPVGGCTNKPNLECSATMRNVIVNKQSQTRAGWDIWGTVPQGAAIARNKAKLGHPGVSGGPDAARRADAPNKPNFLSGRGPRDEGQMRKTKPIWPCLGGTGSQMGERYKTASRCCRLAAGASGLLRRCGYNEPESPGVL